MLKNIFWPFGPFLNCEVICKCYEANIINICKHYEIIFKYYEYSEKITSDTSYEELRIHMIPAFLVEARWLSVLTHIAT